MASPREPWIKLKIGIRRSDKFARLPSGDARLGWVYTLLEAKVQRRMGVFAGHGHLAGLLGEHGAFVEDFVRAGLLHVAPVLCAECARRHVDDDLESGDLVVHDYLVEQRDPTNAERQAAWRANKAGQANGDVTRSTVTQDEADAELDRAAITAQPVTSASPPSRPRSANGHVTPDSRAGGTTATVTTTETTKKDVPDGEVDGAKAVPTREAGSHLSGPPPAGRPDASPGPSARPVFSVPTGIAAATPKWRHPCSDYVRHQSKHRIIDGQAVCEPCEEAAAAGGSVPAEPPGLWPIQ